MWRTIWAVVMCSGVALGKPRDFGGDFAATSLSGGSSPGPNAGSMGNKAASAMQIGTGNSGPGNYAENYKTPNYTQYTNQDFKEFLPNYEDMMTKSMSAGSGPGPGGGSGFSNFSSVNEMLKGFMELQKEQLQVEKAKAEAKKAKVSMDMEYAEDDDGDGMDSRRVRRQTTPEEDRKKSPAEKITLADLIEMMNAKKFADSLLSSVNTSKSLYEQSGIADLRKPSKWYVEDQGPSTFKKYYKGRPRPTEKNPSSYGLQQKAPGKIWKFPSSFNKDLEQTSASSAQNPPQLGSRPTQPSLMDKALKNPYLASKLRFKAKTDNEVKTRRQSWPGPGGNYFRRQTGQGGQAASQQSSSSPSSSSSSDNSAPPPSFWQSFGSKATSWFNNKDATSQFNQSNGGSTPGSQQTSPPASSQDFATGAQPSDVSKANSGFQAWSNGPSAGAQQGQKLSSRDVAYPSPSYPHGMVSVSNVPVYSPEGQAETSDVSGSNIIPSVSFSGSGSSFSLNQKSPESVPDDALKANKKEGDKKIKLNGGTKASPSFPNSSKVHPYYVLRPPGGRIAYLPSSVESQTRFLSPEDGKKSILIVERLPPTNNVFPGKPPSPPPIYFENLVNEANEQEVVVPIYERDHPIVFADPAVGKTANIAPAFTSKYPMNFEPTTGYRLPTMPKYKENDLNGIREVRDYDEGEDDIPLSPLMIYKVTKDQRGYAKKVQKVLIDPNQGIIVDQNQIGDLSKPTFPPSTRRKRSVDEDENGHDHGDPGKDDDPNWSELMKKRKAPETSGGGSTDYDYNRVQGDDDDGDDDQEEEEGSRQVDDDLLRGKRGLSHGLDEPTGENGQEGQPEEERRRRVKIGFGQSGSLPPGSSEKISAGGGRSPGHHEGGGISVKIVIPPKMHGQINYDD